MEEREEFNSRLDEIRENLLLEIKNWWGHRFPGSMGTIITTNKEVYRYQFYNRKPDFIEGNCNFITKVRDLTDEEYSKIYAFIENEIISKSYENKKMYDASYIVVANYNGIRRVIENNKGDENNPEIYDITEKLLKEII